ncbi:MAG: CDP-diacylglycerol--glycerol-3-phosphate 3-phosphatidyltransferase [Coriobacteriia bacterium]|nr:CDP-diacylglycerol--glycerol-3-phosphate 3-phosphatidyltransferase [Coriobacteriia bacterium]MCL2606083.1 CDP-diacylglycerol--glycerol-3-phosphate 3-phosphatidyltransferase [Coriobacteriia bacterium]
MSTEKKSAEKLGLANSITLMRVLAIPVFLVAFLSSWPLLFDNADFMFSLRPWIAAIVFIGIAVTDALDGYVARKRGEVTAFGMFIDPLADKLLITAALVALIQAGTLPAWIAFTIIAREFIISGLRMVASAQGVVIPSSMYGKVKTWLQCIAIVLFIVKNHTMVFGVDPASFAGQAFDFIAWAVMLITVLFTVLSLLDYYRHASKILYAPWQSSPEEDLPTDNKGAE